MGEKGDESWKRMRGWDREAMRKGGEEKNGEGGRTGQNVPSVYWTHCSQRRARVCGTLVGC